jgi:hypothetical protein
MTEELKTLYGLRLDLQVMMSRQTPIERFRAYQDLKGWIEAKITLAEGSVPEYRPVGD